MNTLGMRLTLWGLAGIGLALLLATGAALSGLGGSHPEPGTTLEAVEAALHRGDATAAEQARQALYARAVASRRWQDMLAAGRAAARVSQAGGRDWRREAEARRAYLLGLLRARAQGSVDGLLEAAEAFAGLGDQDVARQAVVLAERLAGQDGGDPVQVARVRAAGDRWAFESRGALPPTRRAGRPSRRAARVGGMVPEALPAGRARHVWLALLGLAAGALAVLEVRLAGPHEPGPVGTDEQRRQDIFLEEPPVESRRGLDPIFRGPAAGQDVFVDDGLAAPVGPAEGRQ
jgi:hypothetical protein